MGIDNFLAQLAILSSLIQFYLTALSKDLRAFNEGSMTLI